MTIGGIFGHALCTMGAVLGGRLLAQQISVRTGACVVNSTLAAPLNSFSLSLSLSLSPNPLSVTMIGGVVFLIFAVSGSLLDDWMGPAGEDLAPPSGM